MELTSLLTSDQKKEAKVAPFTSRSLVAMNPNRITVQPSIRFTADRIRRAAARLAFQRLQEEAKTVEGAIEFLDDFEQIAIERGLSQETYECFEKLHLAIGYSLVELQERRQRLEPYAY